VADAAIAVVDGDFGRVEDALAVDQLLSSLGPRQRELVHPRYRDELKQREIAERLGVSQMRVSRELRRVIAHLGVLAGAA
jgi:RNA polymerase sigma-B factor